MSQLKTVIINDIQRNNINVTINTNRCLLVESIRYMIKSNYQEIDIAYKNILGVLQSVKNPDKLTQGMIKNLMGDENGDAKPWRFPS